MMANKSFFLFSFIFLVLTCSLFAQNHSKLKSCRTDHNVERVKGKKSFQNLEFIVDKFSRNSFKQKDQAAITFLPDTVFGYFRQDTSRYFFTYSSGLKLLKRKEEILKNGKWENSYFISNTYNTNDLIITELEQEWKSGNWVNVFKSVNTYNANGKILTKTFSDWFETSWVVSYRDSYSYNSSMQITTEISQNWEDGKWVNSSSDSYSYNEKGNLISILSKNWDNGIWVNESQITCNYDSGGNLIHYVLEYFGDGTWQLYSSISVTYDQNGFKTNEFFENWVNAIWVPGSRNYFINDETGKVIHFIAERWAGSEWVPGYGVLAFNDGAGNGQFFIGSKIEVKYKAVEVPVGVQNETIGNKFQLSQNYPNPFNPTTEIRFSLIETGQVELKIFDLLGREVKTLVKTVKPAGNHDLSFDASDLVSGVYIYRLTSGNQSQMKKMILVK